ncbi:MAG TPA: hypothetical protein VHO71_05155 [Caproiciproducens sp.]|nr:hypothetical protein [Caproiciproducens sp.]
MQAVKKVIAELIYIFCNYIIAYIPLWILRKILYRMFGMKIGRGSRINMRCVIMNPWGIRIGDNSMINEYCLLDGRGGLVIGDNVSVSFRTVIWSASHHMNTPDFAYYKSKTIIQDGVWIGTGGVVQAGTTMEAMSVLGANSVAPRLCVKNGVYVGVPAELRYMRKAETTLLRNSGLFR